MPFHRARGASFGYRSLQPSPRRVLPLRSLLGDIEIPRRLESPSHSIGLCLFSRRLLRGARLGDRECEQPSQPSTPSGSLGDAVGNTDGKEDSNTTDLVSSSESLTTGEIELSSSVVVFSANAATTGSDVASTKPELRGGMGNNGIPSMVNSQHDITTDERLCKLCFELEERRVERQKKLFEDMIVFEGGALSDHDSLGTYIIMRDFIQFALYHIKWGYYPKLFRKYRQLMTTGYFDPIPFASLRSQYDYHCYVAKIHESTPGFVTPTQLFQPVYGWVIAEYLVTTYRAKFDPREPLVVYDVGAGTGALALAVLDYLAEYFPAEYARCDYHVIETNPYLIPVLRRKLIHHYHHVHIHHISILNWRVLERRRCVVLAIELLSGLPHDCILWDPQGACSEHWFGFQQQGNLATAHERYYPVKDPIILRYLRYLGWMQEETFHNLKVLCLTGGRETLDPPAFRGLEPNMDDPAHVVCSKMLWLHSPFRTAWIPTIQMLFLETLAEFFPRHHLFVADWASVRQGLPGLNGPVLQVKMRVAREMFLRQPVPSFHSNAGMVDICFPTDFDHLREVYRRVCGAEKTTTTQSHPTFWRTHGGDKTSLFTTKTGFNPLLEDFAPFHVFATHHPSEL
ncbi:unnamed protein product [Phytomonas sp. EM1]|nr:unnamed protein product [Phytomonas sp. EM1]|eukprot:CCW61977.1 unnamed protein product [Phytomonas sp. isolate EM1]